MGSVFLIEELEPAPDPAECCARFLDLPYLAFLDGQGGPPELARYSYLTAEPWEVVRGQTRETIRIDCVRGTKETIVAEPLGILQEAMEPWPFPQFPGLPPFQGGAVGWIGYDWKTDLPASIVRYYDDVGLPILLMGLYDWVIAWDHQVGRAWVISTGLPQREEGARLEHATRRMQQVKRRVLGPPVPDSRSVRPRERPRALSFPVEDLHPEGPLKFRSTFTRYTYGLAVSRAREYIRAGDCFQVNLSQRFECPFRETAYQFYTRLRRATPAPYGALLQAEGWAVISASPERFLSYDPRTRVVETRPIKGTRPRGASPVEDEALGRALLASEKDAAEHVMIVDLLRNDLSRVCIPGTVAVPRLLGLESHPTVHHLVSTIRGELAPGRDACDLLDVTMPGGSVTGAPKPRVCEIITEIEPARRGVYCGAIGWLGFSGALETSVAIRTAVAAGGELLVYVGGGVTADSDPEEEYEETLAKGRAFFETLLAGARARLAAGATR
ncbi:MAG TPA: anthranilate synthase component I family protein [Gemmatimonadales bacterium]|nr:anthranilate synthase component I family protein [Gemmatimonadales bacterium]